VIGMKFTPAVLIATAVSLVPRLAAACAVCFTGRSDETRVAFLATTGLLTALPLLLIGSLVWWLRRRTRQIRDEYDEALPSIEGMPPSGRLPSAADEPFADHRPLSLVDLRGE